MNSFSLRPLRLTVLLAGLAALSSAAQAAVVVINLNDPKGDGTTAPYASDTLVGPYPFFGQITDWLDQPFFGSSGPLNIDNDPSQMVGIGGGGITAISAGIYDATPTNFSAGASIGSGSPWNGTGANQLFRSPSAVSPHFGAGSYLGFRIEDQASPGHYYYGWLEVTWNGTSMNILSGAYERTVDTAILAGATSSSSSVPDSSSTGALGLLLGGMLVRHWRRQRRAA